MNKELGTKRALNKACEQKLWTKVLIKNHERKLWTEDVNKSSCKQKLWTKIVSKYCEQKFWTQVVNPFNVWETEISVCVFGIDNFDYLKTNLKQVWMGALSVQELLRCCLFLKSDNRIRIVWLYYASPESLYP